jgi:integrase
MRREPYWTVISEGCALGYRRGAKGGTWIGRFRDEEGKQHHQSLGAADDARDPDGLTVFSFPQAQEKARTFFTRMARERAGDFLPSDGPYTVAAALDDYFASQERKGAKGAAKDRSVANARIAPELGSIDTAKLSAARLRAWHHNLSTTPKMVRTKTTAAKRAHKDVDGTDANAVRRRRATANRLLTILKAALNTAHREGRIASDEVWRAVRPFRAVDSPVIRFLTEDECRRLVNACEPDFRNLVRGALLTGCRYGELCRLSVSDVNLQAGTATVRETKAGKPRHVVLTDEARTFFAAHVAGKAASAPAFARPDGEPWGPSHQLRPIREASERAGLHPLATFHVLRHTHASALAMAGVPMGVVAAQLGHADTRITERHYAHLSPSYVAETIRANFPVLGIAGETAVVPLRAVRKAD